jgi:hypothetical protein
MAAASLHEAGGPNSMYVGNIMYRRSATQFAGPAAPRGLCDGGAARTSFQNNYTDRDTYSEKTIGKVDRQPGVTQP